MKCPKCGYLGFESTDRCRNCGYEFALSDPGPTARSEATPELRPALDLDRVIGAPPEDLPLFDAAAELSDAEPLITMPPRPRAPLGVRRATPEIPRARVRTPRPSEETLFEVPPAAVLGDSRTARMADGGEGSSAAGASRVIAAVIDAAILCGLDASVLYFTLRLCDLTPAELLDLPMIPLLAFFVLLNGGYFVAFTAVGGQSIGKMAVGIRVVSDQNRAVPFGRATLRTLAYLVSALPLGAGFLPAVFGADHLALHDRLAHTRVIRPASL
jgi:uncharacterized RDD family membrane protein YckC